MGLTENWSRAKREARRKGLKNEAARKFALLKCIEQLDESSVNALIRTLSEKWQDNIGNAISNSRGAWKDRTKGFGAAAAAGIATGAAYGLGTHAAGALVGKLASRNEPQAKFQRASHHLAQASRSRHAIPKAYHSWRAKHNIDDFSAHIAAQRAIAQHASIQEPNPSPAVKRESIESIVDGLLEISDRTKQRFKSGLRKTAMVGANTVVGAGEGVLSGGLVGAGLHTIGVGKHKSYGDAMKHGASIGALTGGIQGFQSGMSYARKKKVEGIMTELESPMPYKDRTGYEAGYGRQDPDLGWDDYTTAELLTAAPMGIIRQAWGDDQVCGLCGTVNHMDDHKCCGCDGELNPLGQYAPAVND